MRLASCAQTSAAQSTGCGSGTLKCLAIRLREPECSIVERLNDDPAFVHQPMVEAAERDEVRELRLASMRPMLHVMAIDVALEGAAGETAALVSCIQGPANGGRNRPRPATDVERLALLVLDNTDDAGVAGKPSRRLGGDRRPVFELAAAGVAVLQRLGIHVHHDLLTVAARKIPRTGREEALGHRGERLDPTLAGAVLIFGIRKRSGRNVFGDREAVFSRLKRFHEERTDLGGQPAPNHQ